MMDPKYWLQSQPRTARNWLALISWLQRAPIGAQVMDRSGATWTRGAAAWEMDGEWWMDGEVASACRPFAPQAVVQRVAA